MNQGFYHLSCLSWPSSWQTARTHRVSCDLRGQLADLGLVWQAPLLRALGVVPASGEFARSAAREVLRQGGVMDGFWIWMVYDI